MRHHFWLIFLLCTTFTKGQDTDSLIQELINNKNEDTTKVVQFALVSRNFSYSDPELGLIYADSALKLANKNANKIKLGSAFAAFAYNYSAMGLDSLAVIYSEQAYQHYLISNQLNFAAKAKHNQGLNFYNLSNYAEAIAAHKTAFDLFKKIDFKPGLIQTLNSLGINFMELGDYPRSLSYLLQSLQISEEEKDSINECQSLMNIGLVYEKFDKFPKALQSHMKALRIAISLDQKILLARIYNNLGNVYDLMNETGQAISLYKRALAINEEYKNDFGIASNYSNLGIVELKIGNYDSAYFMFNKALNLFKEIGDENNIAMMFNEIGDWFINVPDEAITKINIKLSDRIPLAFRNKQEALSFRMKINDRSGIADTHEGLSELYQKTNQLDSALFHYKLFVIYKDSIFNDKAELQIIKNELESEFDKQKALDKAQFSNEIKLKQAEVERQKFVKNGVLVGLTILAFSGMLAFISYKRKRDAIFRVKEAEIVAEKTEVEMKALRAQMNPHFIFNSLNSINDFIARNNSSSASDYTIKFAKLMRMVLENSEKSDILISDDLAALEWYMQLEQIRSTNKFHYRIKISETINPTETLIPPLILQPFVENSIWHGFQNIDFEGTIFISISCEENQLLCVVEDNGRGRSSPTTNYGYKKSMGTNITHDRINLINKTHHSNHSVLYSDLSQGLRVQVTLPYKTTF